MANKKKNYQPKFRALLDCNFTPTESDSRLHELAKQYHEETEAYDRSVCSLRNERGFAIPVDNYERGLINMNALKVKQRILKENQDIEKTELHRVISRYFG